MELTGQQAYNNNSGVGYLIKVPRTQNLINNQYYKVVYNNGTQNFFESDYFILSWGGEEVPSGSGAIITNPSGDITGSIDLTTTNNKIDNVANKVEGVINAVSGNTEAIKEQTKAIESGNNILQNIYNDLFTLQSGDLEAIITNAIDTASLPSGELEVVKLGLDQIQNQGSDFIISWNSYNPNFTIKGQAIRRGDGNILQNMGDFISGDSINFSKLERENEGLHTAMVWARRFVGLALLVLFAKNCWNTLMNTLGIGTQIYDKSREEQAQVKTSITTDANGNKIQTKTLKSGNMTQIWKRRL